MCAYQQRVTIYICVCDVYTRIPGSASICRLIGVCVFSNVGLDVGLCKLGYVGFICGATLLFGDMYSFESLCVYMISSVGSTCILQVAYPGTRWRGRAWMV